MAASVEIRCRPGALASVLRSALTSGSPLPEIKPASDKPPTEEDERTLGWSIPARLKRTGIEKRLLVDGANDEARRKPDHSLARLLAQAQQYHAMLMRGHAQTMEQLAREPASPAPTSPASCA